MRATQWVTGGAMFALILLGGGRSTSAELSSTNGCQGSGTFRDGGFTIDAESIGTQVVTIPRHDTVDWEGSVEAPPGKYHGSVSVDLPPPFGTVTVDSWKGDSQTTSNTGTHEYDLPSLVPAGVEIAVNGTHTDENGTCNGTVTVQLKGGVFDSPLTLVSLGGTAVTGAGLAFALRPMFRRVA